MSAQITIEWTPEKLANLRKVYDYNVKHGKESFVFEGNEYLVAYAKYLIEYLQTRFPKT